MTVKNRRTPVSIRAISLLLILAILCFVVYYLIPSAKIPQGVLIDKLVVIKSEHKLYAWSKGKLWLTYKIAIGKNNKGAKEMEGDLKTPEGFYLINDRNAQSGYHKNLGLSYPEKKDLERATALGQPAGGNIKIHGLKNGHSYIGKLHRWKDWTNGCIALTDEEMDQLYDHVPLGTPIEIRK